MIKDIRILETLELKRTANTRLKSDEKGIKTPKLNLRTFEIKT